MTGRHDHPAPTPKCGHLTLDGTSALQYCAKCDVVHCPECKVEWVTKTSPVPFPFPTHPINPGNYNMPARDLGPTCTPVKHQEPAPMQFVCEHH